MSKLLMSRDNPTGWKLEEILETIAHELSGKNELLKTDDSEVSQLIQTNNRTIINNLNECVTIQRVTMEQLDTLGKDQGPTGEPRIGKTAQDSNE